MRTMQAATPMPGGAWSATLQSRVSTPHGLRVVTADALAVVQAVSAGLIWWVGISPASHSASDEAVLAMGRREPPGINFGGMRNTNRKDDDDEPFYKARAPSRASCPGDVARGCRWNSTVGGVVRAGGDTDTDHLRRSTTGSRDLHPALVIPG